MTDDLPQLTLIGTVHRDPHGRKRLTALLEKLQPELLTLEMSPFALQYRQTRGQPQRMRLERILQRLARETGCSLRRLQSHPAVRDIYSLLALPYEYQAARCFANRAGIALELLDDSKISSRKLERVESELITLRNLKILTSLPGAESLPQPESYATAQNLLGDPAAADVCRTFLNQRRGREGVGPRDLVMAERIRRLLEQTSARHLAHIGGWVHLLDDPLGETLFSRLADLAPCRRLLVEPAQALRN
jgi:hypothetical protein